MPSFAWFCVCLFVSALFAGCGVNSEPRVFDSKRIESQHQPLTPIGWYCDFPGCPPGTVAINETCTYSCPGADFCDKFAFYTNAVLCAIPTPAPKPTGSIDATPMRVTVPAGGLGFTRICWKTEHAPTAEVYLQVDGVGADRLFAGLSNGCQDAPWIEKGHFYVFKLYLKSGHAITDYYAAVYVKGE